MYSTPAKAQESVDVANEPLNQSPIFLVVVGPLHVDVVALKTGAKALISFTYLLHPL